MTNRDDREYMRRRACNCDSGPTHAHAPIYGTVVTTAEIRAMSIVQPRDFMPRAWPVRAARTAMWLNPRVNRYV